MRLFLACNASSSPPVGPLLLVARPAWHVQEERISLSNPLALPVVKGSQRLCRRRQASRPSPDLLPVQSPQGCRTDSPSTEGRQHCVQLICQQSQSVQRHQDFSRCVRFCHRCRLSIHGPRQDISRSSVHTHDEVFYASCPRYELTLRVLQRWRLSQTFRIHQ